MTYDQPAVATTTLNIDQAKVWSFKIDDYDEMASDLNLINIFSAAAAESLKNSIDADCLQYIATRANADNVGTTAGKISNNIDMGVTGTPVQLTTSTILSKIVDVNTVLDEQNVPAENRFLVIPAWAAGLLKKSDIKDASITNDASGVIRTGVIGMIDRTKIIQSNLVYSVTDGSNTCFYCMAGTKEAVTFANQLVKTETLRIPTSFGQYIRGLSVYGRAVVQPKALVALYARKG